MIYSSWADQARASVATSPLFDSVTENAEFCGDLFFGVVRPYTGAIGTYVEFHYRGAANQLVATAMAYVAPYDDVVPELRGEQFTFDLSKGSSTELSFAAPQVGGSRIFQMTLWITVELVGNSGPKVLGARAQLRKDPVAAREYRFFDIDMPSTTFPDAEHNVFVTHPISGFVADAKSLCPNCFGIGSEKTMEIPKADLESGATGYALFSCNMVNGREACPVCGGAGGKYLRWYLDEHPELASIKFKAGNGLLRK